jgi:hypothetical protein
MIANEIIAACSTNCAQVTLDVGFEELIKQN